MVFPRAPNRVPWGQTVSLGPGEKSTFTWYCGGAALGKSSDHPVVDPLLPFFLLQQVMVLCMNMKDTKQGSKNWLLGVFCHRVESTRVTQGLLAAAVWRAQDQQPSLFVFWKNVLSSLCKSCFEATESLLCPSFVPGWKLSSSNCVTPTWSPLGVN